MSESALSVYLRSVAHLYPGGIPKAALKAARQNAVGKVMVLFMSCEPPADAGAPWSDPSGVLLRAAIEKGLKLPLESAEVVRSQDAEQLRATFRSTAASLVVCLGGDAATAIEFSPGEGASLSEFSGKRLLCTVDLSRSASDPAAKRQFWQDLQPLLAAL